MNALGALTWLIITAIVALVVRSAVRSFRFWRRWPRWKPTYNGSEVEAMHLHLHLSVKLHSDPAGPWQTWTWKVSERDNRKHGAVYSAITIGAASTMKQACVRAVRCAEERAQYPTPQAPPPL